MRRHAREEHAKHVESTLGAWLVGVREAPDAKASRAFTPTHDNDSAPPHSGTDLTQIALLYRAIDGTWRCGRRDRNVPITPARASRILALAVAVPGAHVDPADVDTDLPGFFGPIVT